VIQNPQRSRSLDGPDKPGHDGNRGSSVSSFQFKRRNASALARVASLLLATLAATLGTAQAAPSDADIARLVAASKLEVQTFKLENGMDVVVVPDHRMPVVTHMVWFHAGAADERPGKSGIAHFLEHLMFKGTKKIPPGEYSRIVARNGGQDNAFTSWDYTAYFERVAKDRLELVMGMNADRLANLQLNDKIVLPELKVILEERRQRIENNPESLLGEQMSAALYENSRYGVPIIGWFHEMEGLTTADALDWWTHHYAPNNAVLVVAGDITADELKPLAERTYGKVKARDVPGRHRTIEPAQSAARRVTVTDARAEQLQIARTYHAPNETEAQLSASIDVLSEVLGGSPTSRLHKALVLGQALAAGVSTSYDSTRVESGEFSISATPRPGVSLATLEAGIDGVLAKLLKDGVTGDEVRAAKFSLISDAAYERDSGEDLANLFGQELAVGASVDHVTGWPARVAAVTPEAVMAAAKLVLKLDQSVTGLLIPEKN
jgi:zinc protease